MNSKTCCELTQKSLERVAVTMVTIATPEDVTTQRRASDTDCDRHRNIVTSPNTNSDFSVCCHSVTTGGCSGNSKAQQSSREHPGEPRETTSTIALVDASRYSHDGPAESLSFKPAEEITTQEESAGTIYPRCTDVQW